MCYASQDNLRRLTKEAGEHIALEDLGKARGFLRVRVMVNMDRPLSKGCWIVRGQNRETWVKFRYERLQDFCYRCGYVGHVLMECNKEGLRDRAAQGPAN